MAYLLGVSTYMSQKRNFLYLGGKKKGIPSSITWQVDMLDHHLPHHFTDFVLLIQGPGPGVSRRICPAVTPLKEPRLSDQPKFLLFW